MAAHSLTSIGLHEPVLDFLPCLDMLRRMLLMFEMVLSHITPFCRYHSVRVCLVSGPPLLGCLSPGSQLQDYCDSRLRSDFVDQAKIG